MNLIRKTLKVTFKKIKQRTGDCIYYQKYHPQNFVIQMMATTVAL